MGLDWLNYRHLYYFWMIVRRGGFLRAAESLRLSQSSLSHQIKTLEQQFGEPLFDRTSKRTLRLTATGRKTFEYAEVIFKKGRELESWVRSGESELERTIYIGAVGSLSKNFQILFLRELLQVPGIRLQVRVGEVSSLIHQLKEHQLDLIISNVPAPAEADPFAINQELGQSSFILAGSRAHKSVRGGFPRSLEGKPVFQLLSASAAHLHFDRIMAGAGVTPDNRGQIEDVALLRLIGLSGEGLIFVPRVGILHELRNKVLFELHRFKQVKESFYMITHQAVTSDTRLSQLLEKATQRIRLEFKSL